MGDASMLNLLCSGIINSMEFIMAHNLVVAFMFSWVGIKYIIKVMSRKNVSMLDNISLAFYIVFITTMSV